MEDTKRGRDIVVKKDHQRETLGGPFRGRMIPHKLNVDGEGKKRRIKNDLKRDRRQGRLRLKFWEHAFGGKN